MSSYDARSMDVLTSLNATERTVYWLRAWREGEEPPQELRWVQADDRLEYDRLLDRIQAAHNHIWNHQVIMQNWLAEEETALYWLASVEAAAAREKALLSAVPAARRKELALPDPVCPHDVLKGMEMLWGVRAEDAWSGRNLRFSELREFLHSSVRKGLVQRWEEQRAWEVAFEALGEEINGDLAMHADLREFIRDFKDRLWAMAGVFRSVGGEIELPEPSPERIQFAVETIMPERLQERLRREEQDARRKEQAEKLAAKETPPALGFLS